MLVEDISCHTCHQHYPHIEHIVVCGIGTYYADNSDDWSHDLVWNLQQIQYERNRQDTKEKAQKVDLCAFLLYVASAIFEL